jgi:hypothetical protein
MTATRVAATTESADATHGVKRLPGRVFNAENVTMTDEGRIFVTGSEAVYEFGADGTLNTIPVEILPQDCMKNGISTDGRFLYLACTRIHGGDKPLFLKPWCDVNNLEQTPLNFIRIILAEKIICQVDSCIVRATLEGKTSFNDVVARKDGEFFANGLAIDASGMLYVANSFAGASAGLYRARSEGEANLELWHQRAGCVPNGVKIWQGAVYYTGFQLLPAPSALLVRVEIGADGSAGESEVVYSRLGAFFDDFDITEDGFVIADIGDLSISPFGSGALLFVDADGRLVNIFRHEHLQHPSAVKVVGKKTGQFEKGDILVTEKSGHCVVWIRNNGGYDNPLFATNSGEEGHIGGAG